MRFTPSSIRFFVVSFTLSLLVCDLAQGQTPVVSPTGAAVSAQPAARAPLEQRTEHILIEDASSVIDEVRVGGESKSITVLPKGGLPAYQVAPKSGERSWKILGF